MITGGGTGGHVFPALALAEEFRAGGFTVLYVGSRKGLESRLVPEKRFPFYYVKSGAVKNQSALTIIRTLFTLCLSVVWALRFLWRERPAAVIGVGGYVSVPVGVAAWVLRIPLYLQEQNVSVGIANRMLGRLSKNIFLGFDDAKKYFSEKKCIVTGNPIRKDFFRPDFPPVDTQKQFLLIMGGSQGARAINDLIVSFLEDLNINYPALSILHQTGNGDFDGVRKAYENHFKGAYAIVPFLSDVVSAYAMASLVVCRSGALTVSELICVRRPALFVPYPRAGQNDQTANAHYMERSGVARVVEQGPNFRERFWEALVETLRPAVLARMLESFSGLRTQSGLVSICGHIERDLKRHV